jgi:hypothetical protein
VTNLFFISSSGSMATKWMSEVLSASSSVKCFHGSTGLQPTYDANLDPLVALSLAKKWGDAHNIKFVGMNHLSNTHGLGGVSACKTAGARFCALVRNPIVTTDSQYQERTKEESLTEEKIASSNQLIRHFPTIREIVDPTDVYNVIFSRCAITVLMHLSAVEVHGCEMFKFENYTTDYSQIQKLISFITNGVMSDDHENAVTFETLGKTNTHRKKTIGFEETWKNSWSNTQRQIYIRLWKHLQGEHSRRIINYPNVENLIQTSV